MTHTRTLWLALFTLTLGNLGCREPEPAQPCNVDDPSACNARSSCGWQSAVVVELDVDGNCALVERIDYCADVSGPLDDGCHGIGPYYNELPNGTWQLADDSTCYGPDDYGDCDGAGEPVCECTDLL